MAIALASKVNVDNSDANFPYGKIKNDSGIGDGTPISEQVYQDMHQFFAKMLNLATITANGSHDNETNGYQYIDALLKLAGHGAWIDASGTFGLTAVGGGSVTGYTVVYDRYRLVGKTLQWQILITGATIAGAVSNITINRPSSSIAGYVNAGMGFPVVTTSDTVRVFLSGFSGPAQITLGVLGGATFSTGSGREWHINITAEVT
jgi:hypothetical protein